MAHRQGEQGNILEMWAMDEHRVGLQPIVRRVFAPRGQRPVVKVHPPYEWLYIYAFAHPSSGRSFYLLMPTVSIPAFTIALPAFANFVQADHHKPMLLLLDNAAWHTSPQVQCPTHISFQFLPAYSPELQPAEHLWHFTDKPLINRRCTSLDELESILIDRCAWLQDQQLRHLIRSTTLFHWWPTAA